jgi:DNA polymerase-3 subunit gamma/tau
MLTKEAFNALLKTLEEPPAHVKFIFATTEPHKVPVTILSRCQKFDFKRIPLAQIIGHLEKITKQEGIESSRSGLALIAKQAEGSMRDAQSLLDQVISFTGPKIEDRYITEVLGIISKDIIFRTSRAIIEGKPRECLEIVDHIYSYGYDIKEFYRALMDQFRNLLFSLIAPGDNLLDMTESEKEEAARQADIAGQEKLQVLLNFMISREEDLRFTSHPRLILETTIIKLCHLGDFLSFGEILTRIESLEKRLSGPLTVNKQQKTDHISDPGSSWSYESDRKDQSEKDRPVRKGQGWNDFLAFLSSKNKSTFNVLKDWQLLELSEQTLEIAKSNQPFSSTYFDDKERYEQLVGLCRDFFQRDIQIKILGNNKAPKDPVSKGKTAETASKRESNLPGPVQDILHMFQGEILEEDSTKKAEAKGPEAADKKRDP